MNGINPTGGERSPWYSLNGFGQYLKLRVLNWGMTDAVYKKLSEGTLKPAALRWLTSTQLKALKEKIRTVKESSENIEIINKIAGVAKEAFYLTRKESRQNVLRDIAELAEANTEYPIKSARQDEERQRSATGDVRYASSFSVDMGEEIRFLMKTFRELQDEVLAAQAHGNIDKRLLDQWTKINALQEKIQKSPSKDDIENFYMAIEVFKRLKKRS